MYIFFFYYKLKKKMFFYKIKFFFFKSQKLTKYKNIILYLLNINIYYFFIVVFIFQKNKQKKKKKQHKKKKQNTQSFQSPKGLFKKAVLQKKLAKTKEIIAISLIKILRAGPEVSFKGSPTVSPITAALCSSDPFFLISPLSSYKLPPSMYFLALSQAPPVLDAEIAIWTPETSAPGNNPETPRGPNNSPV